MKKWNLQKTSIALFAIAMLSGIFAFVCGIMALKTNPDFGKSFINSLGQKVTEGRDYQENADEDLHGIQKVLISSNHGDMDLQTYDGPTLKVEYSGKVPKNIRGPLIVIRKEAGNILHIILEAPQSSSSFSFIWDNSLKGIRFSDVSLQSKIYLPRNFAETLHVESINGDIHFLDVHAGSIVVESTNGDVELQKVQSSEIKINMANGDFNSEGSRIKNWAVENVHGDLHFHLPEDQSHQFDLNTTHGSVENSIHNKVPANVKDVGLIRAKTVSGDIYIEKYVEGDEDRE